MPALALIVRLAHSSRSFGLALDAFDDSGKIVLDVLDEKPRLAIGNVAANAAEIGGDDGFPVAHQAQHHALPRGAGIVLQRDDAGLGVAEVSVELIAR